MSHQIKSGDGGGGVGITTIVGSVLAAYCSYTLGNPVGWIAIHSIFNWVYILYLCAGFGGGLPSNLF